MRPRADGLGLYGSGMFVLNPPWQLDAILRAVMPTLVAALGQDDGASWNLELRQA